MILYFYSNNLEIQLKMKFYRLIFPIINKMCVDCGKEQSPHMILSSINSEIAYVWSIRTGLVETRSRSCVVASPAALPRPSVLLRLPCLRLLPPPPSPSSLRRESRSPPDVPASGSHHHESAVALSSRVGEEKRHRCRRCRRRRRRHVAERSRDHEALRSRVTCRHELVNCPNDRDSTWPPSSPRRGLAR